MNAKRESSSDAHLIFDINSNTVPMDINIGNSAVHEPES